MIRLITLLFETGSTSHIYRRIARCVHFPLFHAIIPVTRGSLLGLSTAGTYLRHSPAPIKAGRSPAEPIHTYLEVGRKKYGYWTEREGGEKISKKETTGRTGNRTPDLSHAVKQLEGYLMLRENYTTKPSAHLRC
ncbi:hypothetical protein GGI35DRAFT_168233 [Trichoderma velutinum]